MPEEQLCGRMLQNPEWREEEVTTEQHLAPKGSLTFNGEDRLTVINLTSSYGPLGDENRLDEWRDLFWEDAEMVAVVLGVRSGMG